ncbi:hypothetical protein SRIMM317S_02131 [Streptomyces rimosus subsp. rimosus]
MPACRWMSARPMCSYGISPDCRSCTSASSAATDWPGRAVTRTGMVLANRPTIASTPGSSAGRPAVTVPKTTSSRPVSAPSTSDQAAWKTVLSVTPRARARAARPAASRSGTSMVSESGSTGGTAVHGRQAGRLVQSGERVPPRGVRGVLVLRPQPGQVVPVRGGLRQPGTVRPAAVRVQREQVLDEHRQRPAVGQAVVQRPDERVPRLRLPDQHEPHQRRPGQVEAGGPVGLGQLVRRRGALLLGEGAQVRVLPRKGCLGGHELDRRVQALLPERGAQVRVPVEQRPCGVLQGRGVQRAPQVPKTTWVL